MLDGIVTTEDLLTATDFERVGDLRRSLDEQHIRYFLGKGGKPWTTMALINAAGGIAPAATEPRKLGPGDL